MDEPDKSSSNLASTWNGSIAIKITAATVWAILILTFAITIPFTSSFEESSIKEYSWQQHQVEELIKESHQNNTAKFEQDIQNFFQTNNIQYIEITSRNSQSVFGKRANSNLVLQSTISINSQDYDIYLEFPSLKRSAVMERVKIGSAIVTFAVLFSLFLFWLNKKIIHTPFDLIIEFIQNVSLGNTEIRLNTDRGDEFGLLSKFLNKMLDTINSNQLALKKANDELKDEIKHRDEALAASQQKSAFLANMSHEIRTPLSSIIGYSERIRFDKAKDRDDEKQMLDIVLQNGNHLLHLINDILDLSKVEANKLEIEKTSFSIVKVVEHARRLLNERALEKSIQLDINYLLPIPKQINNDPIRTKQIILNLASNAIRFTEHGKVSIDISYQQDNDLLMIEVKDSGIGISEENQKSLFQPFSQADPSISRKYGGTGLGLTISKRLAELMQGDIIVQSVKDIGSRFTCTIKAGFSPEDNSLITELSEKDLEAIEYEVPLTGISLSGKMLLVEDTYEIQQLIKAYIEDYGIHIDTADNGKQGLEMALSDNYDLILMDIQMPIMNGKEAIVELRSKNYIKPVIALTADALTEHAAEFSSLGFTETLTKPIVINDLLASIQRYIPLRKNRTDTDTINNHTENENTIEHTSDPATDQAPHQKDILHELKIKYMDQLPAYVNELKDCLDNNDLTHAHTILHQLKGISGSLGYNELTDIATETSELLYCGQFEEADKKVSLIEKFYSG